MKKGGIFITAILLLVSIGNYYRIKPDENIRSVVFISIFAIGVIAGVLLVQIIKKLKGEDWTTLPLLQVVAKWL